MRSENEVYALRASIRSIQDRASLDLMDARSAESLEDAMVIFNSYSQWMCVLDWVLGADTIKVAPK